MTEFTPSQLQAITSRNTSLLVSAGAGSGKTMVLSQRICDMLASGETSVERILVMTFTKAAAAEMKDRIRRMLLSALETSPNKEHLTKQLTKLEKAHISTIHSYCMDIIGEFYYVCGADPSFRLIDDNESTLLGARCAEEYFAEKYASQDEDFALCEDIYSSQKNSETFKKVIIDAYKYSLSFPLGPKMYEKSAEENYNANGDINKLSFSQAMRSDIEESLANLSDILTNAKRMLIEYNPSSAQLNYLESLSSTTEKLSDALEKGLGEFIDAIREVSLMKKPSRKKGDGYMDSIYDMRDEAADILKDMKGNYAFSAEVYSEQQKNVSHISLLLSRFVSEYAQKAEQMKKRRRVIEFSDLEHICLKILNDPDAAELVKNKFDYVFVDEYQDVNDIQEEIIRRTAKEDNLFAVGDIKQSIYSFRGAKPEIFAKRRKAYEQSASGELITLAENFRSDRPVINSINALFSKIMFEKTSLTDYMPKEALIFGRKDLPESAFVSKLVYIEPKDKKEKKEDEDSNDEIEFTARLIEKLLNTQIYDEKLQTERRVVESDICVIGRSMNDFSFKCASKLKALGINSSSDEDDNFFDQTEIALAVNLLRLTDNFRNDLALLGVMRSVLYGFNEDELVKIRLENKKAKFFHLCVKAYAKNGTDEKLKAKLVRFINELDSFKFAAKYDSIHAALSLMYAETHICDIFAAFPQGEQRVLNLKYLIKAAAAYEQNNLSDLGDFISFADRFSGKDLFKGKREAAAKKGVRLLTTHKSKGLEFNIVIVRGISKRYNMKDCSTEVIFSPEYGICTKYKNIEKSYRCDSLIRSFAASRKKLELKQEEMRLLYVAATRAKQQLYLLAVATERKLNETLEKPLSVFSINSRSNSFVCVAPAVASSSFWEICSADELLNKMSASQPAKDENSEAVTALPQIFSKEADLDEYTDSSEKLTALLSYKYPGANKQLIPTKMSVSALENENDISLENPTVKLREAAFFGSSEQRALTAAQKGTLTHKFLEKARFSQLDENALEASLSAEADLLCKQGVFTQDELKYIDINCLAEFFRREVGVRLLHAENVMRETSFIMRRSASELKPQWKDTDSWVIIQGMIDCYFPLKNEDGYVLLDYKTDRFRNEEDKKQRIEQYMKQINFYRCAIAESTGKSVKEAYICFLNEKNEIKV